MSLDEFLAEYRRRSLEGVVALLRESGDVGLHELRGLLVAAPELRQMTLSELFEGRRPSKRRTPAPPSAAVKVAAYLLDRASTAGKREGGGVRVRAPSYAQIGEHVGVSEERVALTVAILERRRLITVHPRRIVVRDLRGLALLAERPLAPREPRV